MFNKVKLATDTQLTHDELANSLLNQAIEQLAQLSGMSTAACEKIMMSQFTKPETSTAKTSLNHYNLVSQPESEYISTLFN